MRHVASVSFGKDSLAMLLMLIEKGYPLDEVVFYDTGKEFKAIYKLRDYIKPKLATTGIKYTELTPKLSFDYKMFDIVRTRGKRKGEAGYSWCGGMCRWGTTDKLATIDNYCKSIGAMDYVGIAWDETHRLKKERKPHKLFPLAEWKVTEAECLDYCKTRGYVWLEATDSPHTPAEIVDLYGILDRVSCWCCRNKNLKELKNIYQFFYNTYWRDLKKMQERLELPMKPPYTVHELERRFEKELKEEAKK